MSLSVFNLNDLSFSVQKNAQRFSKQDNYLYTYVCIHTRADQYKVEKVNCDYFHNEHLFLEI